MMRRLTLPLLLIVVGAALVCFGVIGLPHTAVRCISYKASVVLTKATHICLECIGIG